MEPIDLVCLQVTATQRVDLTPEEFSNFKETDSIYNQINNSLEEKIKNDVEGKCNKNGLVLNGSVRILTRDVGYVSKGHFNGNYVYNVTYQLLVCNPSVGVIIPCKIIAKNKIGLMAHFIHFLHFNENDDNVMNRNIDKQFKKYPIVIKIPAELHKPEQQQYINDLELEEIIYVEVLGRKFDLEDKQISVVAKLSNEDDYLNQIDKN